MAIQFNCPFCTAPIRVPDAAGGKRGRCPKCKSKLRVPKPDIPAAPPASQPAETVAQPAQTTHEPAAAPTPTTVDATQFPPETPTDAIGTATPAVTGGGQTHVSYARALRRRRARKNIFWIPILFGVLLVGGIAAWFFWQGNKKLEGELQAVELIEPLLAPKMLTSSDIALESDKIRTVFDYLEENQIRGLDSGRLMEHSVEVTAAGMSIQVFEPPGMRFFRVDISANADLRDYYKTNQKSLDEPRLKALESGVTAFFRECLSAAEEGGGLSTTELEGFRRHVAVNHLIGGLGYNVIATVNRTAYLCVYEDKQALYFLLPAGTKRFTLKGRELNSTTPFPGKFTVVVTGFKKRTTAKPDSDAAEPTKKTPKSETPENTDKSPPENSKND